MEEMSEQKFKMEVITRLTVIETKLDGYTEIKEKADKAINLATSNKEDIEEINENRKWLWRTLGATIMGVLSSLISMVIKMKGGF